MNLIPLLSGRFVFGADARRATHLSGGRLSTILVSGDLFLSVGSILLDCVAVRIGVDYDVPASGFVWRSQDGLMIAMNEVEFSGGGLTPSGLGPGTLIQRVINTDPMPTTIYRQDEEV